MANKLSIDVYGTRYSITSNEDPQYVAKLGKELDRMAADLMRGGNMSINQALVLIALNCLDSYKKSETSADHLRGQVAEYLEDAALARMELEDAQRDLEKLRRESQAATV